MYLRIETRVRGILLAEISKKSLRLKHGEVKKGASVTHMNTDTVGAIGGIHRLHEVWSRPLEVVVNVYILSTVVKQATFLFVLPFAGKLLSYLHRWSPFVSFKTRCYCCIFLTSRHSRSTNDNSSYSKH